MNEQELIQLFAQEAEDHAAINWFDQGSPEFDFTAMKDITAPLLYVQTIGATEADNRLTYTFTIYCLDLPAIESEVDNSAFAWDSNYVAARDACKAALRDVICEVKVQNKTNFTLANTGSLVSDGDADTAFVGWRQTITITQNTDYDTVNFPTT